MMTTLQWSLSFQFLEEFFQIERGGEEIMLTVHEKGVGICGVFVHEVAETKVKKVEILAKKEGFPLKASIEEE